MSDSKRALHALRERLDPLLLPTLRQPVPPAPVAQSAAEQSWKRRREMARLVANAMRVSPELTPRVEAAARAVAASLACPRELFELFVYPRAEINGFCMVNHLPVTIGMTSEAVTLFDESELRFLIGHELGHACFREITEGVTQAMTPEDAIRVRAVELTVDRVGLLAARDAEASCRAILKMMSGLPQHELRFDFARFAQDARELDSGDLPEEDVLASHPPIPIRFRALMAFARSDVFASLTGNDVASGVRIDMINRTISGALDRVVDRRARHLIDASVRDVVLWVVTSVVVQQQQVSTKAITQETGVTIDRDDLKRAMELVNAQDTGDRTALVAAKLDAAITHAYELAPRRMVDVLEQIQRAVPSLRLTLRLPELPLPAL